MLPTNIYPLTLAANATQRLLVQGEYFKLLSATGPVKVTADAFNLDGIVTGQGLEKTPFSFLTITNKTAAVNTLSVLIGDENFLDAFTGNVAVTQNKVAQSGSFVNVSAAVTSANAQLLAANAGRQYLLIQNKDSSGSIYVNFGSAATSANGVLIGPGGSYELAGVVSTQAINAIGSIASNSNIVTVEG
jgi:hypothetical protein